MRRPLLIAGICSSLAACQPSSSTTSVAPDAAPTRTQTNQEEVQPAQAAPVATARTYAKPAPAELRKKLTAIQYDVTQNEGTEPPFHNTYWDNHEAGIYVDIVTGEPLFSSTDKFESGTGWPSFTRPIEKSAVKSKTDSSLGMERTEVRSATGDSHLGHVFDDGPRPTGLRYCINSAALRFIPVSRLEAEGYGEYARLFPSAASGRRQD